MKYERYQSPVFLTTTVEDSHLVKPLPHPTGTYPYRFDIRNIPAIAAQHMGDRMAFHMVGDTGSARHSAFQSLVASALARQHGQRDGRSNVPSFLYHLGDIVYNHGEAAAYPEQFLNAYERYPGPIFAIPGNHDGDINPDSPFPYQSLEAFVDVFCDTFPRKIGFGRGSRRLSMVQPNVYWTLETPLARFIGLYTNVPKHGWIGKEQRDWFIEELRHADRSREQQALLVCLHHTPYSADSNHGSSAEMIDFLENAFLVAGVWPDAVFSGHVHNYQRFSRSAANGVDIPYIVAGAGGYADLHRVAAMDDPRVAPLPYDRHPVRLEAFCDDAFGFLAIAVEKGPEGLILVGSYYTLPTDIANSPDAAPTLFDRFELSLKRDQGVSGYLAPH